MYRKKPCKRCSEEFQPVTSHQKFCGLECRFWSKVAVSTKAKCWIWQGSCGGVGYGTMGLRTKVTDTAHRVSYRIANGDIPQGMFVCHRCDNKLCVNPAHLFLGTPKQNCDDMWGKGRQHNYSRNLRGSKLPQSKTTESIVRKAKKLLSLGRSRNVTAKECGLSISQMHAIASGKTWRHVTL
jgi:hypothetical protein